MSKKIRFIKENDLFDWKVGDEATIDDDGSICWLPDDRFIKPWIPVDNLINKGYAEWVEEDESEIQKEIHELELRLEELHRSLQFIKSCRNGSTN